LTKNLIRKIVKIALRLVGVLGILIFLFIGIFWYIFENKKDWIVEEIQLFVNENISGELQIESIEFLPIKFFPKAGFKLKQVKFYESKNLSLNKDEPPFFKAEYIDAKLDLWPLLRLKKLKLEKIDIEGVSLYLKKPNNNSLSFSEAVILLERKIEEQIDEFDIDIRELSSREKEDDHLPNISFNVNHLLYKSKQYENIESLEVRGRIYETRDKINLTFNKFDIKLPYGIVSLMAKTSINDTDELKINGRLKLTDFPYNYLSDPIEKIVPYIDPSTNIWDSDSIAKFNLDLNFSTLIKFEPFTIKNVQIENAKMEIRPVDEQQISMDSISFMANDLFFLRDNKSNEITGFKSVKGNMKIGKIDLSPIGETEIKMSFTGKNNKLSLIFDLNNKAFLLQEANVHVDFEKRDNSFYVHFLAKEVDLENLLKQDENARVSKGKVDMLIDLQTSGLKLINLTNNLHGNVKFSSKNMTLYGMNIDDLLKTFERTQKFNLLDVSAFLLAGPIGTVTTKGTDFMKLSGLDLKESDSTYISNFIADLNLSKGQLITKDVAVSTLKNRIAVMGKIDWVNDTIPNLTVAVLDKHGCAKVEQKFYGRLDSIQMGKVNKVQIVFGSVKNTVKSVFGKKCKPFYTGTINHPK